MIRIHPGVENVCTFVTIIELVRTHFFLTVSEKFLLIFPSVNFVEQSAFHVYSSHLVRTRTVRYGTYLRPSDRTFSFLSVTGIQLLKGTVSLYGFGFWWHVWLVLGLIRVAAIFKFFRCFNFFLYAKSVFLLVNASLLWLNNVSGVYLTLVSLLLIGQQGSVDFFWCRFLLPIGWRTVQILRQCRKITTNTAPSTLSASVPDPGPRIHASD